MNSSQPRQRSGVSGTDHANHIVRKTIHENGITRRTMAHKVASLLTLGSVPAIGLACGAPGQPSGAASASKAPASVTYMTSWNTERMEVLNQGMAIFRQKFPHIQVETVPSPGNEQIVALFAAGSGPDSFWVSGTIGPRIYESGQLLDLSARVKTAKINLDKDYISSKLERWGSKIYAMPHTVSPHAWYYNKTLLKRAGAKDIWDDLKGNWTWADMLDMAKKVTKVTGGSDEVWGIELDYVNAWYQNSGFVWTNGGKFVDTSAGDTNWRRWKYTFSDPKTLEGLQFIYDLLRTHRVMITKERADEIRRSGVANLFSGQKTAMFENSSGQLITQINAKNIFEWDIAPIPRVRAGGKPGVPLWSGNPTAVNKDARSVDATWELALQMSLDDFQNLFSRARSVTAALVRSLSIPGGFETPPPAHVSVFRAVGIENSGSWDYHPAFTEVEAIVRRELGLAYGQQKALRQACLDIDTQANAVMARS